MLSLGLGLGIPKSPPSFTPFATPAFKAVSFDGDGANDTIVVADSDTISFDGLYSSNSGYAISMWVKLKSGQDHGLLMKQEEYALRIGSDTKMYFTMVDDSANARLRTIEAAGSFAFNQWTHLYFQSRKTVATQPSAEIFVNGVNVVPASTLDGGFVDLENTNNDLLIGRGTTSTSGNMGGPNLDVKGNMANIAFIEGPLTSAELASVYAAGRTGDITNHINNTLRAYYKFEDNLLDSSGNGNNGTDADVQFVSLSN